MNVPFHIILHLSRALLVISGGAALIGWNHDKKEGFPVKFFVLKRKWITGAACLIAALALVGLVNHPAIVGAAATTRQLPIYCVPEGGRHFL